MPDPAKSPKNTEVAAFHKYDDVNVSPASHHHTIGQQANEVAAGKHFHDGKDSPQLLAGTIFTGIVGTYNPTTFRQVMAALVKLGASDTTS